MTPGLLAGLLATVVLAAIAVANARAMSDRISVRALLAFPLVCALAVVVCRVHVSVSLAIALACVCICAATDWSSGYVYNVVTYPSMVAIATATVLERTFTSGLTSAGLAFALLAALYTVTRRGGIGLGDVKLFVVTALAMTSLESLAVLFASFVGGALYAVVGLVTRSIKSGERIAFAPYIAAAVAGVAVAQGVQ